MPSGGATSHWLWYGGVIGFVLLAGQLFTLYMTRMPGASYRGPLAPLTEQEQSLAAELRAHVTMLAGTIGERNMIKFKALEAAADYILDQFREMGYDAHERPYTIDSVRVRNIEAELTGHSRPDEIIILGAHYDSVFGAPGANDNASGVAALLALARLARNQRFARTVRFVAFVNEEPPVFQSGDMGSQRYARECRERNENIVAMLSLETIGYYSDAPRSQVYPAPFSFFYPHTGNFIAFVGNLASRSLVRQIIAGFRADTRFPSEGVAAPAFIPGVGWSDHWSFWQEGFHGVMVTDTALFRYPQYHTREDTPEILDYDRLARVTAGLHRVIASLAGSS